MTVVLHLSLPVHDLAEQGSRHFGVGLEPIELDAVLDRLRRAGDASMSDLDPGTID